MKNNERLLLGSKTFIGVVLRLRVAIKEFKKVVKEEVKQLFKYITLLIRRSLNV